MIREIIKEIKKTPWRFSNTKGNLAEGLIYIAIRKKLCLSIFSLKDKQIKEKVYKAIIKKIKSTK